jgi:Ca2+-binding RTX toxin-like protein
VLALWFSLSIIRADWIFDAVRFKDADELRGNYRMTVVTLSGAAGHAMSLNYSAGSALDIARQIASAITTGVFNKTMIPASSGNGPPPPLPPGMKGEFIQQTTGVTFLPGGYDAAVNLGKGSVLFGSGGPDEMILTGAASMTFFATGGSGTVVGGDGGNRIIVPPNDSGAWLVATGSGNDTVTALGTGNDTIMPGGGNNIVVLGDGNDKVTLSGNDTLFAGAGNATIDASAALKTLIQGGAGAITYIGGAGPATILGGSGSDTVLGGTGDLLVHGGSAGNNLMFAGAGAATLFGGGSGDVLFAEGSKGQALHAGGGNETLSGVLSLGHDTLYGGTGKDQLTGGFGNDTLVADTGSATMTGGFGQDVFTFVKGQAGGSDVVQDFSSADTLALLGYGSGEVLHALKTQDASGGNVTVTLSDHTQITFVGLTSLTGANFTGSYPGDGVPHGGSGDDSFGGNHFRGGSFDH